MAHENSFTLALGAHTEAVQTALQDADRERWVARLWAKDPALWSEDAAVQAKIINRLGWLASPVEYRARLADLEGLRNAGYQDVVLLGMGGSSLAPELLQRVFGNAEGSPRLHVLDSTSAESVNAVLNAVDVSRTAFVASSKSGTTVETKSFTDYFYTASGEKGEQFIAVTDPGSTTITEASERGYKAVFYNSQDIGGRYSVYSFFGLVPAALIGMDVDNLLGRAADEIALSSNATPTDQNAPLVLGVTMAELAKVGRNKLTFLCSPSLEAFGDWAEQLIAESTGKQGQGVLPVVGERPAAADKYEHDRLFVYLRLADEPVHDDLAKALEAAGQPVIVQHLRDKYDVGAQFFRWEFATAVAGISLGINPFDEPNVTESKQNTKKILDQVVAGNDLPAAPGEITRDYADALREFLASIRPPHYVAITAYVPMTSDNQAALRDLQAAIRDTTGAATTLGFGPRYLHSTGQYHKGGPAQGAFVQIVADDQTAAEIPDAPYPFSTLFAAQGLGDLEALQSRNYPTIRLKVNGSVADAVRGIVGEL